MPFSEFSVDKENFQGRKPLLKFSVVFLFLSFKRIAALSTGVVRSVIWDSCEQYEVWTTLVY